MTIEIKDLQAVLDEYEARTANPDTSREFFQAVKKLIPPTSMEGKGWDPEEHFLAEVTVSHWRGTTTAIMLYPEYHEDFTTPYRILCTPKGSNRVYAMHLKDLTPTGRKFSLMFDTGLLKDNDGDIWEKFENGWSFGETHEIRKKYAEDSDDPTRWDPHAFYAQPLLEEF